MLQSGELSNTSMTHLASREGHSQSLGEENMEKPQLKGCSSFREIHTEITSGFVFVGSNHDKLNRNRAPKEVLTSNHYQAPEELSRLAEHDRPQEECPVGLSNITCSALKSYK